MGTISSTPSSSIAQSCLLESNLCFSHMPFFSFFLVLCVSKIIGAILGNRRYVSFLSLCATEIMFSVIAMFFFFFFSFFWVFAIV